MNVLQHSQEKQREKISDQVEREQESANGQDGLVLGVKESGEGKNGGKKQVKNLGKCSGEQQLQKSDENGKGDENNLNEKECDQSVGQKMQEKQEKKLGGIEEKTIENQKQSNLKIQKGTTLATQNDNFDSQGSRVFRVGEIIENPKKKIAYKAIQMVGKGTFGQVLSVVSSSNRRMAMKVVKKQPAYTKQGLTEIKNLRQIAKYELLSKGDTQNYINIYDAFLWEGHLCIVMELLDNSIFDILETSAFTGVQMKWIQKWAKQLLLFLTKIHKIGIYHCDIKPQNIMFRPECPQKPLLIDFSSSCMQNQQIFTYIQSRFYRSPEVLLGIRPYTDKIDIWSLGCVLVEMYLGLPLFPGGCGYDQVSKIYAVIKQSFQSNPVLVRDSEFGSKYFNFQEVKEEKKNIEEEQKGESEFQFSRKIKSHYSHKEQLEKDFDENTQNIKMTLKKPSQYRKQTLQKIQTNNSYYQITNLNQLISYKNPPEKDLQIHQLFIDLIKQMLVFDPVLRISAEDAFFHPFIGGIYSQLEQIRQIEDIIYEQNNKKAEI